MVKLVACILEDYCKQITAFDFVFETVKKNHTVDRSKLQRRLEGVYFCALYKYYT